VALFLGAGHFQLVGRFPSSLILVLDWNYKVEPYLFLYLFNNIKIKLKVYIQLLCKLFYLKKFGHEYGIHLLTITFVTDH